MGARPFERSTNYDGHTSPHLLLTVIGNCSTPVHAAQPEVTSGSQPSLPSFLTFEQPLQTDVEAPAAKRPEAAATADKRPAEGPLEGAPAPKKRGRPKGVFQASHWLGGLDCSLALSSCRVTV
jgi:hypothetical protein